MPKILTLLSLLFLCSCQQVYYSTMEVFGKEKRHLLVNEVEDLSEDQEETAQIFESVLERIQTEYNFEGGALEQTYQDLSNDFKNCQKRHKGLIKRINTVDEIGEDLFEEWQDEIDSIATESLKTKSQSSLRSAQAKFYKLSKAMRRAETKIPPVLTKLNDYVLFLKHNLNAQAVGSLGAEMKSIEKDVAILIKDMKTSISEADNFLKNFQ